jgi:hypothetical protein
MGRAISVCQLYNKKRKLMEFTGPWQKSFGNPELKGAWIIWAESGSGKTSFAAQLCKYLTQFGRVAYNSLEEGDSESMRQAFQRVFMEEVKNRIILLDQEPIEEMKERLRKHKAPQIIIIDSIQYSQMSYKDYIALKKEFVETLFIFISHAEGKQPEGRVAKRIRFDVSVKIRVEGYRAFVTSRYGGSETYTIWEEGARIYWNEETLTN